MREERRLVSAWALSVLAHAALVGSGALIVAGTLAVPAVGTARSSGMEWGPAEVPIELPTMVAGSVDDGTGAAAMRSTPASRGGGEGMPRLDDGRDGRGGTDAAALPALNLADRDDATLLSAEVPSRFDRSQIQRIKSARHRASREDIRLSRDPMELTFLASGGTGARPERRTPAEHDPSAGGLGLRGGTRGGALGAAALPLGIGEAGRSPGGALDGGAVAAPGAGVRDGRPGSDHRDSADVATGRPLVEQGTPSVPASVRDKPADTTDSEQEVALAMQSLLHASTAGGRPGQGPGGSAGPGATGNGGEAGPGSRSRALGTGNGGAFDNDPRDRRRNEYMRRARGKIDRLWAFPKWAALEGMQGTVIVSFVIQGDGSVSGARVTRPSGIAEFDESCRQAVLRAGPYGPLPSELGQTFPWSLSFDARNPAVRPKTTSPTAGSQ
ncbi:MAG: energy transducer TonB [Polyangiaceae bacterium]